MMQPRSLKNPFGARQLLWLWTPLAAGHVLGLDIRLGNGLVLYDVFPLLLYAYAFLWWIRRGRLLRLDPIYLVWFVYVVASSLLLGGGVQAVFRCWALLGVYLFALYLSRHLTLKELFQTLRSSCTFFVWATVVFSVVFPHLASRVNDGVLVYSGFFVQKNVLGRFLSFVVVAITSTTVFLGASRRRWVIDAATVCAVVALLLLSDSRTSLFASVVFIATAYGFSLLRKLTGAVKALQISVLLFGAVVSLVVIGIFMGFVSLYGIGSNHDGVRIWFLNLPLSGRATIWAGVISSLDTTWKWLFGFGYGVFYSGDATHMLAGIGLGSFIPSDSHNGYLDAVVNSGLIGLAGIVVMVLMMLRRCRSFNTPGARGIWVTFLCMYLFINLTESYFVKTTNIFVLVFYIGYCYAYAASRGRSASRDATSLSGPLGFTADGESSAV